MAAEQVLDPSPQTRYPRKEKKGGGAHPLQPSLIPGSRYRFTSQDVTGKVIFSRIFDSSYVLSCGRDFKMAV